MSRWPKISEFAHAFLWEYSYKGLKWAQLLGRLDVLLTLPVGVKYVLSCMVFSEGSHCEMWPTELFAPAEAPMTAHVLLEYSSPWPGSMFASPMQAPARAVPTPPGECYLGPRMLSGPRGMLSGPKNVIWAQECYLGPGMLSGPRNVIWAQECYLGPGNIFHRDLQ